MTITNARGSIIRRSNAAAAALVMAAALALTACAAGEPSASSHTASTEPPPTATTQPTSIRDAAALTQLRTVAAASAVVDGSVTRVDCWMPSQHMVGASAPTSVFSVQCRVHYDLQSTSRYKDMRCIGDFDKTPMLTSCYRWAYHALEPRFEDGDALASPSPTP
jgi:hypothetical protein